MAPGQSQPMIHTDIGHLLALSGLAGVSGSTYQLEMGTGLASHITEVGHFDEVNFCIQVTL
jgi:hypothetical protein